MVCLRLVWPPFCQDTICRVRRWEKRQMVRFYQQKFELFYYGLPVHGKRDTPSGFGLFGQSSPNPNVLVANYFYLKLPNLIPELSAIF